MSVSKVGNKQGRLQRRKDLRSMARATIGKIDSEKARARNKLAEANKGRR